MGVTGRGFVPRSGMLRIAHGLHSPGLQRYWRVLWLCLAVVVCGFAFAPAEHAPTLGLGDKVNHIAAFMALGFVAALAQRAGRRAAIKALALCLGLGVFIEMVQAFLPTRTAEFADLLGDAVGIGIGMVLTAALRRLWPPEKI